MKLQIYQRMLKVSWIPMKDSPMNWVIKKWTIWSSKQCRNIWVFKWNPRSRFRGNDYQNMHRLGYQYNTYGYWRLWQNHTTKRVIVKFDNRKYSEAMLLRKKDINVKCKVFVDMFNK